MTFADITVLLEKLEGEYKHYVIFAVIIILTAFFSRFVFKTLKWFLLLFCFGVLMFVLLARFSPGS